VTHEAARVHRAFGGAAAAWPLAARAQQPDRMRRIGVLMPIARGDLEAQKRIGAFVQALEKLGWLEGKAVAFEMRYADGKPEPLPALASELVQANVDVIVTTAKAIGLEIPPTLLARADEVIE
jgi:putative tryptophan/tyrosine transport system substrate-binding protein